MSGDLSGLHPDVKEFIECLERMQAVLAVGHEDVWRDRIQRGIDLARRPDGYCVELFLSFFGGMGSVNDLSICGSDEASRAFGAEQSRACTLAKNLRH